MTNQLPPNLLALFAPRPALRYLNPSDYAQGERRTAQIDGLASFVPSLKEPPNSDANPPTESWLEKRDRLKLEKKEATEQNMTVGAEAYKPDDQPKIEGDALKTLMVARLSYDTEKRDLEREFGKYGPIERVRDLRLARKLV